MHDHLCFYVEKLTFGNKIIIVSLTDYRQTSKEELSVIDVDLNTTPGRVNRI